MDNIRNYSVTQFPLKISEFKGMLETRNKEDVVGYACMSTACPMAKILKKECGGFDTYVHNNITSFGGHNYENPEWVRKFVDKVDEGKETNDPITVEEALTVIDSIEEKDNGY